MADFQKFLKRALAMVLSVVGLFAVMGPATFSPVDADNLQLNFALIADTHIGNVFEINRLNLLSKGLKDIANATVVPDTTIIAGDLTERGKPAEHLQLSSLLITHAKADTLLLAAGNHDIRGVSVGGEYRQTYEYGAGKYFEFLSRTLGERPENIYYYKIVNGFYFIVLNTEAVDSLKNHLSPEQVAWADGVLALAAQEGKPAFVINHQSFSAIGDGNAELDAVLRIYSGTMDIFFMSGHHHRGFGPNSVKSRGTVHYVDLPSFGKVPNNGYLEMGCGFQLEVYDREVLLRARNFVKGEWLPEYDFTVALINTDR